MLNCRDASLLASQAQDRELRRGERFGLGLHLAMCGNCRRFERQIRLLQQALQRLATLDMDGVQGPELSPAAQERIRFAIASGLK